MGLTGGYSKASSLLIKSGHFCWNIDIEIQLSEIQKGLEYIHDPNANFYLGH